jgi:hypothetical protein
MDKKGLLFAGIVTLLLSLSFAVASFDYKTGGTDIATSYSAGEKIRGVLNISFSSENAGALLKSNFNGSIRLVDLLESNGFVEGADYECNYKNCVDGYKAKDSADSLSLDEGTPQLVGFKISGEDIEVTAMKFDLASDSSSSCTRQLIIDVLDKNESFIQNDKNSGSVCSEEFGGCFNYGLGSYTKADITSNPYCENITLRPAPAYNLGARVDNGTATATLTMKLYDTNWEFLGDCDLPKHSMSSERLGCVVNYSITRGGEFFVCIMSSKDDANYKIRIEEDKPACGTASSGPPYDIDYEIFANPLSFEAVGTVRVNETLFSSMNNGGDLVNYINNYISENYDKNCSAGCAIPFKIEGIDQSLTISNAELKYRKGGGGTIFSLSDFYKFEKDGAKLTTPNPVLLDIGDAGFTIPIDSTAAKLYLYLDEKPLLPNPLDITLASSFGFDIAPKSILVGVDTEFQILTSRNITQADWDFGDGTVATSTGKSVIHRYRQINEEGYKVVVNLVGSDGVAARNTFDVNIGSLSESANAIISEYESRIRNISQDIAGFPAFIAEGIRVKINVSDMENKVAEAKNELLVNATDATYLNVISNLIASEPPASITVKEDASAIPLIIGFGNLNTDYIAGISEAEIDSQSEKDNLKLAITNWFEKNYEGSIDYKVIAESGDGQDKEPILTWVKININKKADADESADEAYLVMDYPKESIVFAGNYSEKAVSSGTYIPISGTTSIEFLIYEDIAAEELGTYVSPVIERLEGYNVSGQVQKEGFQWGKFFLWLFILLFIAFAAYIALQEWYKRRYEAYLFKNPNDLYNVITFIYNSRKGGLQDGDIGVKLKIAGWNGEQVAYALKKIDGKRTGMWEIPIFRFFEKRKVMQEIEKRRAQKTGPGILPSTNTQKAKPLLK